MVFVLIFMHVYSSYFTRFPVKITGLYLRLYFNVNAYVFYELLNISVLYRKNRFSKFRMDKENIHFLINKIKKCFPARPSSFYFSLILFTETEKQFLKKSKSMENVSGLILKSRLSI